MATESFVKIVIPLARAHALLCECMHSHKHLLDFLYRDSRCFARFYIKNWFIISIDLWSIDCIVYWNYLADIIWIVDCLSTNLHHHHQADQNKNSALLYYSTWIPIVSIYESVCATSFRLIDILINLTDKIITLHWFDSIVYPFRRQTNDCH